VTNIAAAVPATSLASLFAGQEYFVCSLTINHAKTVGTGACSGCNEPVCIVFDRLKVFTPVLANDRQLNNGANGPDSQFARWQNGEEMNVALVSVARTSASSTTIRARSRRPRPVPRPGAR
jgi:hypothetical protein